MNIVEDLLDRGLRDLGFARSRHSEAEILSGILAKIDETKKQTSQTALECAKRLMGGKLPKNRFVTPAVTIDDRTDETNGKVRLVAMLNFDANTRIGLEGIPPFTERVTKYVYEDKRFASVSIVLIPQDGGHKGVLNTLVEKSEEGEEVWGRKVYQGWLNGYYPARHLDAWARLNGELEHASEIQQLVERVATNLPPAGNANK